MIEKFLPEQAEVWFQSGTEGQSCQQDAVAGGLKGRPDLVELDSVKVRGGSFAA